MVKYLFNLIAMYANTDEQYLQPDEVAAEIRGQSSDINAGFGGKYVWLHPEWTSVKDEAVSDLSFEKSSIPVRNYNDLAMGAGGDFRYIKASRGGSESITKVGLFRVKQKLPPEEIKSRIEQSGFTHYSGDMNEGRGGDYLYLLWAYCPLFVIPCHISNTSHFTASDNLHRRDLKQRVRELRHVPSYTSTIFELLNILTMQKYLTKPLR